VETLLPTEHELCKEFKVSRHTVREAIRRLKLLGLVSQRAGIGTRVELPAAKSRYVQPPDSIAEMLKFSTNTRLQIRSVEMVKADGAIAAELQCQPGEEWLLLDAIRLLDGYDAPFAWSRIYVNKLFADVKKYMSRERIATYQLIEKHFDETVTNIRQDITACTVSLGAAKILRVAARSPALRVVRRYTGKRADPLQVSVNIHPAGRFTFSMQLELDKNLIPKRAVEAVR
jgi:GntR family transcriptional regulator